jgi:hypothetical protein
MTTCTLMLAGLTAYSMLTHDGRRMVSHVEGTNTVEPVGTGPTKPL